jgi:GNAT superfamily N-acetyltransferase
MVPTAVVLPTVLGGGGGWPGLPVGAVRLRMLSRVTCILVERGFRGQGLAAMALRGAVQLIAQAGGGRVEGYPHDTAGVRRKNSSFLYNSTRTMYEREGFTYDRPKGQGNCVMVRDVTPTTRG